MSNKTDEESMASSLPSAVDKLTINDPQGQRTLNRKQNRDVLKESGEASNPTTPSQSKGKVSQKNEKKQQKDQSQSHQQGQKPVKKSPKEMTKAERRELQERQRAEKAARVAAGVANPPATLKKQKSRPSFSSNQGSTHAFASQNTAADSNRFSSPVGGTPSSARTNTPLDMRADDTKKRSKTNKAGGISRTRAKKPVALFSHLMQYERQDHLTLELKSHGLIHPDVMALGLQFTEFFIAGGNARCVAMLLTFKKVISDYTTPPGTSLQRHLTSHISKQVDFLNGTRALAASMKTAIRFLKYQISIMSIDMPDEDAKSELCSTIEDFIREKIVLADKVIVDQMIDQGKLRDGDVILTYAYSSVSLNLFLTAKERGIDFRVIVCDGRPKSEGKQLLKRLVDAGIDCTYILINALPVIMGSVTKIVFGASAVFSNGAVMSRVGTSVVATMGHYFRIPVIVLCETYKFSEAVRFDSFVWNEIGNPEELVDQRTLAPSRRLPNSIPSPATPTGPLSSWRDVSPLKILNIHYDVTPAKFITMVACDLVTFLHPAVCQCFEKPGVYKALLEPQNIIDQKMWNPNSWKAKPMAQSFEYRNKGSLEECLQKLQSLPSLVSFQGVQQLKSHLASVAQGKKFLLQGGDCAELFEYCNEEAIQNKLKVLLQMSLILTWGGNMPVVRIARMGGQYTKPRSKPTEVIQGRKVLSFRGDSVNGIALDEREPDPTRLLSSYFHAAATINYVHNLLSSDFADLHHPDSWKLSNWDLDHVLNPETRQEYRTLLERLHKAIDFMRTIGADDQQTLKTVEMFMSHEGLLLDYESSLTRLNPSDGKYYDTSAHFLWIGDRTRQLDGAHVEFFRGLANPIGVKVGPSLSPSDLVSLLDILDPDFEAGKVTLITRYGHSQIDKHLPGHIQAIQGTRHQVVWCCDPMHGNTETTASGIKTRRFENIAKELSQAFAIHKLHKSHLGGVHFELTGDRVTETIGGSMALEEADLEKNYQTFCDPRLNYEQSLDIAFLVAKGCL